MGIISFPTSLLGIFVIYHAVWLDGMTNAKIVDDPTMATLLELEKLQKLEDELLDNIKRNKVKDESKKLTDKTVTENCGGLFDNTPGEISHPENAKNYGNNERCIWIVRSSVPLYFYFSKFNTEVLYDFITARDGTTIGSPKLGTYSGKALMSTFITKGDAHIQFDSDENVIGRGFVMHWRVYSAEEQCRAIKGVCVTTGDTCSGIFTIFENSCEDACACCHPESGLPASKEPSYGKE